MEFSEYLNQIKASEHRIKLGKVFDWINNTFPNLEQKIAWNQPMFTDHGTYIIGFSASLKHFSVGPEQAAMIKFSQDIANSGYSQTKNLFQISWDDDVDYDLLQRIIEFNIEDKKDTVTFWRK